MIDLLLALLVSASPAPATPANSAKSVTKSTPATQTKPAAKDAVDLAEVVAKMQKRYDQAKDFKASFTQKYSRAVMNRVTVSTGRVTFKKPGRMRWDYATPEPRMFLANGQLLWLYEPGEKQAFKQSLKTSQLPAALAFLMGKGKITDEFVVALITEKPPGRPGDIPLSLKPKQPQSAYKAITFVVDPKQFLVRESILVDAQGNTNHFVFEDLSVNTKVPDGLFKWSPPAGVRVVDTGKMGK